MSGNEREERSPDDSVPSLDPDYGALLIWRAFKGWRYGLRARVLVIHRAQVLMTISLSKWSKAARLGRIEKLNKERIEGIRNYNIAKKAFSLLREAYKNCSLSKYDCIQEDYIQKLSVTPVPLFKGNQNDDKSDGRGSSHISASMLLPQFTENSPLGGASIHTLSPINSSFIKEDSCDCNRTNNTYSRKENMMCETTGNNDAPISLNLSGEEDPTIPSIPEKKNTKSTVKQENNEPLSQNVFVKMYLLRHWLHIWYRNARLEGALRVLTEVHRRELLQRTFLSMMRLHAKVSLATIAGEGISRRHKEEITRRVFRDLRVALEDSREKYKLAVDVCNKNYIKKAYFELYLKYLDEVAKEKKNTRKIFNQHNLSLMKFALLKWNEKYKYRIIRKVFITRILRNSFNIYRTCYLQNINYKTITEYHYENIKRKYFKMFRTCASLSKSMKNSGMLGVEQLKYREQCNDININTNNYISTNRDLWFNVLNQSSEEYKCSQNRVLMHNILFLMLDVYKKRKKIESVTKILKVHRLKLCCGVQFKLWKEKTERYKELANLSRIVSYLHNTKIKRNALDHMLLMVDKCYIEKSKLSLLATNKTKIKLLYTFQKMKLTYRTYLIDVYKANVYHATLLLSKTISVLKKAYKIQKEQTIEKQQTIEKMFRPCISDKKVFPHSAFGYKFIKAFKCWRSMAVVKVATKYNIERKVFEHMWNVTYESCVFTRIQQNMMKRYFDRLVLFRKRLAINEIIVEKKHLGLITVKYMEVIKFACIITEINQKICAKFSERRDIKLKRRIFDVILHKHKVSLLEHNTHIVSMMTANCIVKKFFRLWRLARMNIHLIPQEAQRISQSTSKHYLERHLKKQHLGLR